MGASNSALADPSKAVTRMIQSWIHDGNNVASTNEPYFPETHKVTTMQENVDGAVFRGSDGTWLRSVAPYAKTRGKTVALRVVEYGDPDDTAHYHAQKRVIDGGYDAMLSVFPTTGHEARHGLTLTDDAGSWPVTVRPATTKSSQR